MNSSKKKNRIVAVIPFFNEEKTIKKVLENVIPKVDKIILINDGSTDNSLQNIINDKKIILINHSQNLGKGKALKSGFLRSIELNYEFTITLDADYQHDPANIENFLTVISNYDCVIGSRKHDFSNMPYHRKLSNYLTSKLLSIKTGNNIEDSQSGYRIFKTSILNHILPEFDGFEAESEMIVKMCRNNYKIGFTPIPTIYGDDDSKMKAIQTIIGFIKVLLL